MSGNLLEWVTDRVRDWFNPGEADLNVPPLEGPLKPNDRLDGAIVVAEVPEPDNLARSGSEAGSPGIVFTSKNELWTVVPGDPPTATKTRMFDHPISALTALSAGGYAVALDGHGVVISGGPHDGTTFTTIDGKAIQCVTDMAEIGDRLWVTEGSTERPARDWLTDLMGKHRTGRVSRLDLGKKSAEVLASRLGWPSGIAKAAGGEAMVSIAWEHRVARLGQKGAPITMWRNLSGYPGRLRAATDAGYWMAMFAMRTKLIEFVLQEDEYRLQMMRDIDPKYWVGPALASLDDHWEPLQGGGIKQLGIVKPWAPPRSYGLVVRLGADIDPRSSLHSRAGAHRHGITSVLEQGDDLYVTSKGNGLVLVVRGAS